MSGHGEKRSRRQDAAIAALLNCPTLPEAATAAGISVATLRRWLQLPEFEVAYRDARAEVVERAIGRLEAQAYAAAETLVRNLRSDRPAAEIRAAIAILEHVMMDRLLSLESGQDKQNDQTIHIRIGGRSDAPV